MINLRAFENYNKIAALRGITKGYIYQDNQSVSLNLSDINHHYCFLFCMVKNRLINDIIVLRLILRGLSVPK